MNGERVGKFRDSANHKIYWTEFAHTAGLLGLTRSHATHICAAPKINRIAWIAAVGFRAFFGAHIAVADNFSGTARK